MTRPTTAREQEQAAARVAQPAAPPALEAGEVFAMLVRRGFRPLRGSPDLPFPVDLEEALAKRLAEKLGHYAFRLFLRGAIQRGGGFRPAETTRYLKPAQAGAFASWLLQQGLAEQIGRGRYRLRHPARSFGGTLEWYVARELRRRLSFDVATGLKFRARGVGGDLDVVAAAEGKLVLIELKSSPPRHLTLAEAAAFWARVRALKPHLALFVVDTALRLSDKVVPLLLSGLSVDQPRPEPRRVLREIWALTPHVYALSAKGDLLRNLERAIAEGLGSLAPAPP